MSGRDKKICSLVEEIEVLPPAAQELVLSFLCILEQEQKRRDSREESQT